MTQRKTPVRVFVTPDDHSRLLIQAGTHRTTPSMLSEAILKEGLDQLERGEFRYRAAAAGVPESEPEK